MMKIVKERISEMILIESQFLILFEIFLVRCWNWYYLFLLYGVKLSLLDYWFKPCMAYKPRWRSWVWGITPVSISYWFFLEPPLCWMTETIFIWRFCCSIWRDTFLFVYVYWEMAENFIFWKFPNMSLYQETLRWLLTVESIELLSKN